jgi:putative oxidoreductase
LGLAFVLAGFTHATRRDQATGGMAWMLAVPKPMLTTIGVLEIAGGIGLVLPAATGILSWLTPLAASLLVVLMIFAAIFHVRRPGEMRNIAFNLILGLIAAFVAYGRYVLEPIG